LALTADTRLLTRTVQRALISYGCALKSSDIRQCCITSWHTSHNTYCIDRQVHTTNALLIFNNFDKNYSASYFGDLNTLPGRAS